MILFALAAATAAPTGTLVLDLDRPVVSARLGDATLTLSVDPDAKDVVELNPAAADRLAIAFEGGFEAQVGRVVLPGRQAPAVLGIAGRKVPVVLSTHGRSCCAGTDGSIGPDLLPWAAVSFRRATPTATTERRFPVEADEETGLSVTQPIAGGAAIRVQFSRATATPVATAAAASTIARAARGRFTAPVMQVPLAFGVPRPVRPMGFDSLEIAGFTLSRADVRLADYRGRMPLPRDPAEPGAILVKGRAQPGQSARPILTLGRDQLDRCSEVTLDRIARTLTLRCDFAPAPTP